MYDLIGAYLARLTAFTPRPIYLVGGSVRDLLSGARNIKDIDLVMPSGSEDVARRFADLIGGSFFFLDEERKVTRVMKREADGAIQFDFTNFEGPNLHADLARRDFTVNAMAIDLKAFLAQGSLDGIIDLFDGRADVRQKLVRVADPKVLDDDPLRLLRAVRFAATLGFRI
jgi:poly(A) polymerase